MSSTPKRCNRDLYGSVTLFTFSLSKSESVVQSVKVRSLEVNTLLESGAMRTIILSYEKSKYIGLLKRKQSIYI